MTTTLKTCTDCGETLPATADHFKKRKDGTMDARCLICRRRVNKGKRKKRVAQDTASIEKGALNTFLSAAATGGGNIPHSSELLERIMDYTGGVAGFAALIVKQYFDAAPGSAHRTKIGETVVRLITKNTELGGAKKPLNLWTDEEIEAELDARLRNIAVSFQRSITNVQASPQTPEDFAAAFGLPFGGVPEERVEGDAGGAGGPPDGGAGSLPSDGVAGQDSPVPGA